MKSYKYMYEINDNIIDENKNIIITDKKCFYINHYNRTRYKFKCLKCGYDCSDSYVFGEYKDNLWYTPAQINRIVSCPCCGNNKTISPMINSISKVRPDLTPYFVNKEDSMRYSIFSNKKIAMRCIHCGIKKDMVISNFVKRGFSCPVCSDKFSVGEKIMYSLLRKLEVNFIKEPTNTTFEWCGDRRYDFYIEKYKMIIEVNGKQHYDGGFETYGGRTLADEINIDNLKYNLAIENGIKEYIKVDASKSDFDYIKDSIINSSLSKYFALTDINWDDILFSTYHKTLVKEVCDYWTQNKTCTRDDISKMYGISKNTLAKYLKIGNKLNWCKYESSLYDSHFRNTFENDARDISIPIKCKENNIYFKSVLLCVKNSISVLGTRIGDSTIRFNLKNPSSKSRIGFTFSYVSKEEFNNAIENGCQCYGSPFKLL